MCLDSQEERQVFTQLIGQKSYFSLLVQSVFYSKHQFVLKNAFLTVLFL
jgi:hypothetical protein